MPHNQCKSCMVNSVTPQRQVRPNVSNFGDERSPVKLQEGGLRHCEWSQTALIMAHQSGSFQPL